MLGSSPSKINKKDVEQSLELKGHLWEDITDKELGQVFLVNNRVLVVRCSSQIQFYKKVYDDIKEDKFWVQYYRLDIRGLIYFIKGNKRI